MPTQFKKKLAANLVAQVCLTVLFPVISFVTALLISRYLGKARLGEYDIASNFFNVFRDAALLGLQPLLIKKIAQTHQRQGVWMTNALLIASVSVIISIVTLNLLSVALHYEGQLARTIFLFSLLIISDVFIAFISCGYVASNRMALFSSIFAPLVVLQFVIYTFFLLRGADLDAVLITTIIVQTVNFMALFFVLDRKLFTLSWQQIDRGIIASLLRAIPVFALLFVIEVLLLRIDVVMLSKQFDTAQLASYSVAKRFMFFVYLISVACANAIFPLLSQAHAQGGEAVEQTKEVRFTSFLMICGIFVSCNIWICAPDVIRLFFGLHYAEAGTLLRILAIASVPLFLSTFASKIIIIHNRQKQDLLLLLFVTLAAPLAYLFAVRSLGLAGGAWAFVFSFSLLACGRLCIAHLRTGDPSAAHRADYLRFGLIGLLTAAAVYLLRSQSIWVQLPLLNGWYLFLLFLFKALTREHLSIVTDLFARTPPQS